MEPAKKKRKYSFIPENHSTLFQNRNNNPNWKGGRSRKNGYIIVKMKHHRLADCDGYVYEHRLIWEDHHKASLLPWSEIHHNNNKRYDNRIENISAMMDRHHQSLKKKDMTKRICKNCGSNSTYKRDWFIKDNGFLCRTCFVKLKK